MDSFKRTTIAGSGCVVAGVLATAALLFVTIRTPASAQVAQGKKSTAIAMEGPKRYTMPHGNFVTPEDLARTQADFARLRRLLPKPSAELERLKQLPAPPSTVPTIYAPEAFAQPRKVVKNCLANTADGGAPPNPSIAVGRTHIMVATNGKIAVYDRTTCAEVSAVTPKAFFSEFSHPDTESLFNPVVKYDQVAGRFVIVANSFDFSNESQRLYFAVSVQADSIDSYNQRRTTDVQDALQGFWADLQVALAIRETNSERVVATATVTPPTGDQKGAVVSVDYVALKNDQPLSAEVREVEAGTVPVSSYTYIPADYKVFLMYMAFDVTNAVAPRALTKVGRYKLTLGATPADDVLVETPPITVPAWGPPPDARQPNGQKLETGDGRFTSPGVRIGNRIWLVHTVKDGTFARPEVYELSTTATAPLNVFRLSSVPELNDHLFNASIAVNGAGANSSAFVNVSRTIPSAAGAAGRPAMVILAGPSTSASGWETNVVKTSPTQFKTIGGATKCNAAPPNFACLWGTTSSIQIDPLNNRQAWGVNELAGTQMIGGPDSMFDWDIYSGVVKRVP